MARVEMKKRHVLSFFILCFTVLAITGQECNMELSIVNKSSNTANFTQLSPINGSVAIGSGTKMTCTCGIPKKLSPRKWIYPDGQDVPKIDQATSDPAYRKVTFKGGVTFATLTIKGSFNCSHAGVYKCALGTNYGEALVTPIGEDCSPKNVSITAVPSGPVAKGTEITFTCSAANPTSTSLRYSWSANGEELLGENGTSVVVPVKEDTSITCSVSNDVGNSSATTAITVADVMVSTTDTTPSVGVSSLDGHTSPTAVSSVLPTSITQESLTKSEAPPTSTPEAPPTSTPEAPPTSTPEAPPTSTPEVPPTSTPEAPPTSTPEAPSTSTPEAPPTSTGSGSMETTSIVHTSTSVADRVATADIVTNSTTIDQPLSTVPIIVMTTVSMETSSNTYSSTRAIIKTVEPSVAVTTVPGDHSTIVKPTVVMDTSSKVTRIPTATSSVLTETSTVSMTTAIPTTLIAPSTSSVPISSSSTSVTDTLSSVPTSSPSVPTPSPSSSPAPVVQKPGSSFVGDKVSIEVTWSVVEGAENIVVGYTWTSLWTTRSRRQEPNYEEVTLGPQNTSYTVEDAEGHSEYCFTVTANYAKGVSSPAGDQCVDTPTTKPSAPVSVEFTDIESTSLVVKWAVPERPNGEIMRFKVYYNSKDILVRYTEYVLLRGVPLSGLSAGTTYTIQVSAETSKGEGDRSESLSVTTSEEPTSVPFALIIVVVVVVVILILIPLIIISIVVLCVLRNRSKQYQREETVFGVDVEMKEMEKDDNHFMRKTPEGLDAPVIELSEDVIETSAGAATIIYVNIEGTPTPQVVWSKDGEYIDEKDFEILSEGSLYIPITRPQDSGTFTVTAANCNGQSSVEVQVEVAVQTVPSPDPRHPPIKEEKFPESVALLRANDESGFNEEYDNVDMEEWRLTAHASKAIINYSKNRYINIVPYDHSRVVLELQGDLPGTDYINASWIDGYKQKRAYIACQGPLPNYIEDFWRMIWQYQIQTVVMVTNLMEGQKIKCHRYWPESGTMTFGVFTVTLKKEEKLAEYTVRELMVDVPRSKESLMVKQFHFTAWPDHGVPLYGTGLLSFRNRVNQHQENNPHLPIVVHCSAGVGRTGTYISIDMMLKKKEQEAILDVFDTVRRLRWQRRYMVQTVSQYVFVYNSLLEAVMCGETCVSVQNFRQRLEELSQQTDSGNQSRCEEEFDKLGVTSPLAKDFECQEAVKNESKNRDNAYLPPDESRVLLIEPEEEGRSDYINASYLDGYSQQRAFIVTQTPLEQTQSDFWTMIWEQKSAVIALLTQLVENITGVQYWPSVVGETKQYGSVTAELVSEDPVNSEYVVRKLKIWRENKEEECRNITQFHYTDWPEGGCPGNAGSLIELINDVQRVQRKSGNHPITIQCTNGVSRSGALCALMTALERVKTEQIVDVFRAVKSLRIQRPGIVANFSQYDFLYKGVLKYLTSFDNYSNFK